jgi:hypothetical protein
MGKAEAPARRTAELHVRAVVLPGTVEQDLYVAGGCYASAGPDRAQTLHAGGYALLGLVDMHNHLALHEPGSPDRASQGLGPRDGCPRVITAGRFLAPPGGYFPGLAREVPAGGLPDAAGVRLLAGSDAGQHPHGTVAGQARLLHAAGAPADFVVYARDPRTDLETLHHPELIVLDGQVIRTRT